MIHESLLSLIGHTPHVRINRIDTKNAVIYAKCERFNPLGSSKDRAALYMIEMAEERGELVKGSVIIEPTSGNTGIALSYIAAIKGYECIIVMPDTMSAERVRMIKALGSRIVLSDGKLGMKGAIARAEELASTIDRAFIPMQFDNSDNALAHYRTTAVEIEADFGSSLDKIIFPVGSGGSITGTARYFREKGYKTKFVAVEPASSPVLSGGKSGRHAIQGIGAGFIPSIYDPTLTDEIVCVSDEEAFEMTRQLARKEGIFAGISSGAALAGALKSAEEGEKILVFLPDSGERYLSMPFWEEDGIRD